MDFEGHVDVLCESDADVLLDFTPSLNKRFFRMREPLEEWRRLCIADGSLEHQLRLLVVELMIVLYVSLQSGRLSLHLLTLDMW